MSLSKTRLANKEKILEAAKRLFSTKGIVETTIIQIAKEAGMDRKTIYNYFDDKETILKELIQSMESPDVGMLTEDSEDLSGFHALEKTLYKFFQEVLSRRELIVLSSQFDDANPDFNLFLGARNIDDMKKLLLYRQVERGISDGSINSFGMNARQLLVTIIVPLFSGMQKFYKNEQFFNHSFQVERDIFRNHIAIVLKGIKKADS